MNKQELVQAMAKATKDTKAGAERWLDATITCIKTGLKKDGSVQLVGFGTWNVKNRKARMGRNPQTGAKIQIKASKTVGFKPGSELKKYVR